MKYLIPLLLVCGQVLACEKCDLITEYTVKNIYLYQEKIENYEALDTFEQIRYNTFLEFYTFFEN